MSETVDIVVADYDCEQHSVAIAQLMRGYSGDVMGGNEPLPDAHCAQIAAALKAFGYAATVLAFSDYRSNEEPVGLITVLKTFSTFKLKPVLNLHDVYVAPEWRGKGLASQMLARVEALAGEIGCCKMTLEVLSNNKIAQGLYHKAGFAPYLLLESAGEARFWEKSIS